MASSESKLLGAQQVKKLGYKQIKEYVLSVGLELPKHVTKGNCIKLIFKEKKYIDDIVQQETPEICASSIEYKKLEKKVASPKRKSTPSPRMMMKKKSSSSSSDGENTQPIRNSLVVRDNFLEQGSSQARSKMKRFKSNFAGNGIFTCRSIQSCVFDMEEIDADNLEPLIIDCDISSLGSQRVEQMGKCLLKLNATRWNNACAINLDGINLAECGEKYTRFFTFVKIPAVREKLISLYYVNELQHLLHEKHEFSHHVYAALTEIVAQPSLVKYLMAIILFSRAKAMNQIHLSKLGLNWRYCMEKSIPQSLYLLRAMFSEVDKWLDPSDTILARDFDKLEKKQIRRQNIGKKMGMIMTQHFKEQRDEIEEEIIEEEEEMGGPSSPKPRAVMTALMTEMKTTIVELRHVVEEGQEEEEKKVKEEKEREKKVTESQRNVRALEFRVPKYSLTLVNRKIETFGTFISDNDLEIYQPLHEEFCISLKRLEETNDELLEIWRDCERQYFQKNRTEFLKTVGDPHFCAVFDVLLETYDIELPDVIWGEIWQFRQPYEKKVDFRYAFELFEEFQKKHGLQN